MNSVRKHPAAGGRSPSWGGDRDHVALPAAAIPRLKPSSASSPAVEHGPGQAALRRLGLVADATPPVGVHEADPDDPGRRRRARRGRPRVRARPAAGRPRPDRGPGRPATAVDERSPEGGQPTKPAEGHQQLQPVVGHRVGRGGQAVEAGGDEDPTTVGRGQRRRVESRPTRHPSSGATPGARRRCPPPARRWRPAPAPGVRPARRAPLGRCRSGARTRPTRPGPPAGDAELLGEECPDVRADDRRGLPLGGGKEE